MNRFQRASVRAIDGSIQIGGRCCRWPWEPNPEPDDDEYPEPLGFWGRARRGALQLAAIVAAYEFSLRWPWLDPIAVAVVLVLGYREALPAPPATAAEPQAEEPELLEDDDPEQELLPAPPEPTAASRQLIIDSVRLLAGGYANVHLAELSEHMEAGEFCVDLSEFRRWVEAHDLRVRDSVKSRGITRCGIRVTDLPEPAPAEAAETPPPPRPVLPPDALQDWSSPQVSPGTTP